MIPETRADVDRDIEATLGLVPEFFKQVPDYLIPTEWASFKSLQLSDQTAIPNKYKELIGLAVSGATRCRYCCYFHTEAARLFGASEDEITETALIAKNTMGWSTYLNTLQFDYDQFVGGVRPDHDARARPDGRGRTRLTGLGGRPGSRESAPVAVRRRLRQPLTGAIEVIQNPPEQLDGGCRSVGRRAHRVERQPRAGNQGRELLPRRRDREDVLASPLHSHTAILPQTPARRPSDARNRREHRPQRPARELAGPRLPEFRCNNP